MAYIGNAPYQGSVAGTNILDGTIETVDLKDGNVTGAKLETLAGLTSGTYGNSTAIPAITIDVKGRVTAISTTAVSIPSGSISVTGGDLTLSGSTGTGITNATLTSVGTAGTYTKITTDAKGRVTSGTTLASSDLPTYTGTITSSQVTTALGFTPENIANKATANGYASLDGSGKVPSAQLPSYVDDVLEYANLAAFPVTGSSGIIYVTQDTNKTYRWTGSAYVEISPSPGTTDSLTEGSTNLYYTNTRARASLSFTAGSGAYNSTTGAITIPTNTTHLTNGSGYITGNQTVTLSGDASGSGATAITVTLANSGVTAGTYNNVTVDAKGRVTSGSNNSYLTSYTETDTLATVTGRGATTSTAVTLTYSIGDGTAALRLSPASSSGSFQWASTSLSSGLGSGQTMIHLLGNATGLNNSGYVGYQYGGSAGSTNSFVSLGLYGNDNILRVYGGTYTQSLGSMRAPIFYDSDDTNYYVNPASTSILSRLSLAGGAGGTNAGLTVTSIANSTGPIVAKSRNYTTVWSILPWGDGGTYISSGTYYDNSSWVHASSDSTNCLLFLKGSGPTWYSSNDGATTWNLASGASLWQNDGRWINNVTSPSDVRAPIFYDSNDTTYYADLNASTSINAAGTIKATAGRIALRDDSIENWATASDSAGIVVNYYGYSSGTSYYRDFTVYDGKGGLRFKTYGSGNYSYASGSMRAPIFYDSDDTNYYLDPNGTSRLYNVFVANQLRSPNFYDTGANFIFQPGTTSGTTRHLNLANTTGDPASVSNGDAVGITWGQRTDSNPYYLIYPYYYANGYSSHTRLRLAWHTGIEIGAASGYGGTRFFDNSPFTGSEIFSVGKGDNHVRVINNLYAPFIYDSSNTAYYIDPNNISNLYDVRSYSYQGNGNVGGTGSASWHPSGIYSAGYNWLYGGINCGGSSITNISAVYSYTFYDATNTAYYIDPASTSNFSALNVGGSAVLTAGNYTSYISSGSEPTFSAFDGLPIGTS